MMSDKLIGWFDNFSQSAAVDMGIGGDDPICVAETCFTVIDVRGVAPEGCHEELRGLIDKHGYHAVLEEAAKHVRTL